MNGTGVVTAEIRHCPSGSTVPPEALATATCRHWSIENGQRWLLGVTFGEGRSRVCERNAARNLAVLCRIALDLMRADTSLNACLKGEHKTAAWSDAYTARVFKGE